MACESNVIDYRKSSLQDVYSGIRRRTQINYVKYSLLSADMAKTATIYS
jgi:hypothetical protein